MTAPTLFPDVPQTECERILDLDAEILDMLTGARIGGLDLSLNEKRVLTLLRYRRGAARARTGKDIRDMLSHQPEGPLSEREVKKAVRGLRMQFKVPIGSCKLGASAGYFLIINSDDRAIYRGTVMDQIRAELAVLRSVDGPQAALEMLGQLQIEVGEPAQETNQ